MVDQLAVIGLQSWYELSRMERKLQRRSSGTVAGAGTPTNNNNNNNNNKQPANHDRWLFLVEILERYSDPDRSSSATDGGAANDQEESPSSSPLESGTPLPRGMLSLELLATVWIPFWESQGHGLEAFAWTLQVLHHCGTPPANTAPSSHRQAQRTIREELWLRCVCQQIPTHLGNNNNNNNNNNTALARKLLGIVTERHDRSDPGDGGLIGYDGFEELWRDLHRAAAAASTGVTADNGSGDPNDDGDGDASLITGLVRSLDAYLDGGEEGPTDSRGTLVRIPNRTLAEARHWLVRKQRQRRRRREHRNGTGSATHRSTAEPQPEPNQRNGDDGTAATRSGASPNATAATTTAVDSTDTAATLTTTAGWAAPFGGRPVPALIAAIRSCVRPGGVVEAAMPTSLFRLLLSCVDGTTDPTKKMTTSSAGAIATCDDDDNGSERSSSSSSPQQTPRSIERRRYLQQALLSVVLFWMGWRGRKLLARFGRGLLWASLAPLREVLDALGPTTTASVTPKVKNSTPRVTAGKNAKNRIEG